MFLFLSLQMSESIAEILEGFANVQAQLRASILNNLKDLIRINTNFIEAIEMHEEEMKNLRAKLKKKNKKIKRLQSENRQLDDKLEDAYDNLENKDDILDSLEILDSLDLDTEIRKRIAKSYYEEGRKPIQDDGEKSS